MQQAFFAFSQFGNVDLANLVWALAKLGVAPEQEWAEEYLRRSQPKLRYFQAVSRCRQCRYLGLPTAEQNVICLFAVAALHACLKDNECCLHLATALTNDLLDIVCNDVKTVVHSYNAFLCTTGGQVELSNTIFSLPKIGIMPSEEWLASFSESAIPQLQQFGQKEYSLALYGLASVGYKPPEQETAQILDRAVGLFEFCKVVDLVKIVSALAQFQARLTPQWLNVSDKVTLAPVFTDATIGTMTLRFTFA